MWTWLLITFAFLFLILIPFAPQLVRLRIRILKWLNWNWAVNLLESHFKGWVIFFRLVLFSLAVLFIYIAWNQP